MEATGREAQLTRTHTKMQSIGDDFDIYPPIVKNGVIFSTAWEMGAVAEALQAIIFTVLHTYSIMRDASSVKKVPRFATALSFVWQRDALHFHAQRKYLTLCYCGSL